MDLNWERLICHRRYSARPKTDGDTSAYSPDVFRSPFESDYDRVIYAKAFRRLGKKTQVHPFETNAHIHNRLTHSLEVASVGRTFARRLAAYLNQQNLLPCRCGGRCGETDQQCSQTTDDIIYSLQAACLVHDIGNPPFGHAGEFSIREWSARHWQEIAPQAEAIDSALASDVRIFEGNAQGFRLAARPDVSSAGYIRATYTTLGAMVKYPWDSSDPRAEEHGKFNFFSSERELAETVFGEMGLWDGSRFFRHPMSFLSEAADDICYRVIDIEDAVEMEILSSERAVELYRMLLGDSEPSRSRPMRLSQLRATVVGHLIDLLWQVFVSDFDAIMRGDRCDDLKAGVSESLGDALAEVKQTNRGIYSTEKKIRVEIGAYKILGSILKALCKATQSLSQEQSLAEIPFIARRCLELAWPIEHLQANVSQPYAWWIHEILDYISGLTDDHACVVANAIKGDGY